MMKSRYKQSSQNKKQSSISCKFREYKQKRKTKVNYNSYYFVSVRIVPGEREIGE